jgi:putative addiction module component (TIGR02574 family)
MKGTAKKVLSAALKLPEPERVELVEELLADLDGSDEDVDAVWAAEIDRRTREIDEGKVKPVL